MVAQAARRGTLLAGGLLVQERVEVVGEGPQLLGGQVVAQQAEDHPHLPPHLLGGQDVEVRRTLTALQLMDPQKRIEALKDDGPAALRSTRRARRRSRSGSPF